VAKDPAEAAKWFLRAAAQGNGWSRFQLALCFDKGEGVPKDRVQAFKWASSAMEAKTFAFGTGKLVALWKRRLTRAQLVEGERLIREFETKSESARLPERTSELLGLVAYDLRQCETDPAYSILPTQSAALLNGGTRWHVDAVGAVMAKTLGLVAPSHLNGIDWETSARLAELAAILERLPYDKNNLADFYSALEIEARRYDSMGD
jgi:hypothetical protein